VYTNPPFTLLLLINQGIGTYWIQNDGQWRVPLAIQTVPALVLCVGMFFLPFSPRWLIERGRLEEAYIVVKRLHYDGVNESFFNKEFHQMKEQILHEQRTEITSLKSFIVNPSYRKRLIIACGVQAGSQFTGINCINYYQTAIYASLGQTGYNVLLLAMAYGTIGTICTFISTYSVDKWGRVKTMLISCILLSCVFLVLTTLIGLYGTSDNKVGKGVVIGIIYVFVIMCGLFHSLPPYFTDIRCAAMALAITALGPLILQRSSLRLQEPKVLLWERSRRSFLRFCLCKSLLLRSRTFHIAFVRFPSIIVACC
jgi:MFS family permease